VKARLLAEHFEARTPEMDTHDFEGSIVAQTRALEAFDPQVVVGSSYGGAILVAMIQRGIWRGPTLLLAQAALRRGLPAELPDGQDIWIVHGSRDDIIDAEDSRVLARGGTPGRVRLFEIDDVHALHTTVEDGRLVEWVQALGDLAGDRSASPRK
jgi:hypothetical protein